MKRTWTIIGVGDVPSSFKWYQALFGLPGVLPAHDYFGQVVDSDGTVLLCLHKWGPHEHPSLMSPDHGTPGNGPCCSSVSMVSTWPFKGRVPSSIVSKTSHTSIRLLKRRSSHSEIRTDITLRSVRSQEAKRASRLP